MVGGVTATVGGADAMKDTDKLMQAFSGLGGGGGLGGDGGDPMASLSKAMSFLYKVDIKVGVAVGTHTWFGPQRGAAKPLL